MEFQPVAPSLVPISLLLEADPSESAIQGYLADSWAYAGMVKQQIVAACIVKPLDEATAEIVNIAVAPDFQQCGIGSQLLKYALTQLKQRAIARVELSTGTFGHQLTYYQRAGFRVDAVVKDHFLIHYPQPIYENGIQHKDMLRLSCDL